MLFIIFYFIIFFVALPHENCFYHFRFFFWWSISLPEHNINQSETRIDCPKLPEKLPGNILNLVHNNIFWENWTAVHEVSQNTAHDTGFTEH